MAFLTAEWRKLIMAQYEVEPGVLAAWLPRGVELDLWQGRCLVSLVGFLFDRVRVKGLAIPLHTRFEEINLRFYIARTEANGERRRGVVFVREFVPRWGIAWVAKTIYEEPYKAIPTGHEIAVRGEDLRVKYEWKLDGRWHSMAVAAVREAQAIAAGSEEEFLTEHYWGYTKRGDGSTSAYAVEHPRWMAYKVRESEIAVNFAELYGEAFAGLDGVAASSVLLAEGSAVKVLAGEKVVGG
jgi:uncharacterized protein YqjF (DUF2071 family)